jgi:hypothetical protein
MCRRFLILFSLAFLLLGTTVARTEIVPVSLWVHSTPTDLTLSVGVPDDPHHATASTWFYGMIPALLDVTFDGGGNPTVNSIQFTPTLHDSPWQPGHQVAYPGSLNASDMSFTFDDLGDYGYGYPPGLTYDICDVSMNLRMNSPAPVTNGTFSVDHCFLDMVGGLVYSNIFTDPDPADSFYPFDNFCPRADQGGPSLKLGDQFDGSGARPIELADTDTLSTITVFRSPWCGSYFYMLDLNASFYKEGLSPGFDLSGIISLTTPTFWCPEPGTFAMLLGLLASLAFYGWKRRGRR